PVWWDGLAHLVPELAAPAAPDERQPQSLAPAAVIINDESRLWEGVFQFLFALARQRPLIVMFDDLHWADASTLGLLGYLARRISGAGQPISLVATTRTVEMRS